MTATDSICYALELARQYQIPVATIATSTTPTAAPQYLRPEAPGAVAGRTATGVPDPEETVQGIAGIGWVAAEDVAGTAIEPAGGVITVAPLPTAELLPDSI